MLKLEELKEGMRITKENCWREILGICGKVIFISLEGDNTKATCNFTTEELNEMGYSIEQDKPQEESSYPAVGQVRENEYGSRFLVTEIGLNPGYPLRATCLSRCSDVHPPPGYQCLYAVEDFKKDYATVSSDQSRDIRL